MGIFLLRFMCPSLHIVCRGPQPPSDPASRSHGSSHGAQRHRGGQGKGGVLVSSLGAMAFYSLQVLSPRYRSSPKHHDLPPLPILRVAPRITDTGPLLRLEAPLQHLTKAQRYGHPFSRPFVESLIPPELIRAVVLSFLEFGMRVSVETTSGS